MKEKDYSKFFSHLEDGDFRLTNARKALLDVLENDHLTLKEIRKGLVDRGFTNLATLYNNLDFFLTNKVIMKLNIDGQTYYDIASDNPNHNHESHIHIVYKDADKNTLYITETQDKVLFDTISEHPLFKENDLEYIQMVISVIKKD